LCVSTGCVAGLWNPQFSKNWFLAIKREVKQLKTKTVAKRLGLVLLFLAFALAFIPGTQARPLRFTMHMKFNPFGTMDPTIPIWEGLLSGETDASMLFYAVGPIPPKDVGYYADNALGYEWAVHFFCEEWVIQIGDDYIKGYDKGCTVASNWKFRMNGEVTDATGEYAYLIGHQVHMHGQITWNFDNIFESTAIGPIIIT
jgi:hypothetical protein